MAEPVFGMSRDGARRTAEVNRRVLNRRVDRGRRTRRVYPPGGGGAGLVAFVITDADCATHTAHGTVLRVQCENGTGVSVGDTIDLIDVLECNLRGNSSFNIGRKGWAEEIKPTVAEVASSYSCRWGIVVMCPISFTC